jgi:hypothetical protein
MNEYEYEWCGDRGWVIEGARKAGDVASCGSRKWYRQIRACLVVKFLQNDTVANFVVI